jgi:hypothetical protein
MKYRYETIRLCSFLRLIHSHKRRYDVVFAGLASIGISV